MEHIESHLGKDISLLTFEYLINDEDYTPFRYEDIVLLDKKITRWDNLLFWAGRNGHLDIIKHISTHIKSEDDWFACAGEAAKNRHAPIFFHIMDKFNSIKCHVMESVGKGGHPEIIDFIRKQYRDADEWLIKGAAWVDNLELFIECIPYLKNNINIWNDEIDSLVSNITHNDDMKIIKYVGEHIDGVILDVDWTKIMGDSNWGGNPNMFRYSLSKGADITKISDYGMGWGDNMEILKHVESVRSIDWEEVMKGASSRGYEHLVLYAFNKGANNWKECMIEASEIGHLSILLLLEREVKEYISTVVWNKCMTSAAENFDPSEDVLDIIKYCGVRGAYNWNKCLREGACHLNLDIITYAESMGADDFQESLVCIKERYSYSMSDDIENEDDYERRKRKLTYSIEEHLNDKLRMCKKRRLF
uniref:Ankyrin repeat protein n=1 Tax=Pithovirus LCPAC401 TaxID=2506595 RepID=A0A481ZA97_9VIRU|nr:MAG: ankyrin repeat protein [Pithovirus LCPAC401]